MELTKQMIKDLGLQLEVVDALPYAVVGGTFKATFDTPYDTFTALTHIVPAGHQLKILFLRIWTQNATGAVFSIVQTNPTALGQTGGVEAFPVVGNVPPFVAGASAVRDYPMVQAPGAEVLHGNLRQPIHVLEGSIDFNILNAVASPAAYSIDWWGVEKHMEP